MFIHTSIRTRNLQRSIDFYHRFFSLEVLSRRIIEATSAEIVFLRDPEGKGCTLELTFYRKQEKFIQPEYEDRLFDHLGFEVVDISKILDEMRKEGITITNEPFWLTEKGPIIAFIEDPDGTLIELIQRVKS